MKAHLRIIEKHLVKTTFLVLLLLQPLTSMASSTLSEEHRSKLENALSLAYEKALGGAENLPATSSLTSFQPISLENPKGQFEGKEMLLATITNLNGELRGLALISSDALAIKVLYVAQ